MLRHDSYSSGAAVLLAMFMILTAIAVSGCGVRADGSGETGGPGENESAVLKLCEAMDISVSEAGRLMELLSETGFPPDVSYVRKWTATDGSGEYYRVRSSDGSKRDVFLDGGSAYKITDGDGGVLYEAGTTPQAETSGAPPMADLESAAGDVSAQTLIILNTNSKKYHYPWCRCVAQMKDENRTSVFIGDVSELAEMGYSPCGVCAKSDAKNSKGQ